MASGRNVGRVSAGSDCFAIAERQFLSCLACYNSFSESSVNKKRFTIPREKIAAFCKRWNVSEFSVFGSAIREDFRPDSDVDVMVVFEPDAPVGLFEMAHMQVELEALFGRPVDLVEKAGLRNPYRRREILKTAKVVYAA
jgi:uncharacterized protein